MAFLNNLVNNPTGGIYTPNSGPAPIDPLALINQVKDRDLRDFKDKANFMADLSLRQDRMKQIYDMYDAQGQPRNVQMVNDPNAAGGQMSAYQKGELDLKQKELTQQGNIESQRIAQQGKLGQEAADTRSAQEKLNQQKSDQIYQQKQNELQAKVDEATKRAQESADKLKQQESDFNKRLDNEREHQRNMEDLYKAGQAQKDHEFQQNNELNKQRIQALEDRINQSANTKTTTTISPDQNTRTTTVQRGSYGPAAPTKNPDGTYTVTTPDGTKGTIPGDKLEEWNQWVQSQGSSDNVQTSGGQ